MSKMNQTERVKHQYSGDKNLQARINLHAKHSTNKQGFYPWLFTHYQFAANSTILELGCGNGEQWKGRTANLPTGSSLILSDFSEGMLTAAKENLAPTQDCISFMQIDIQSIPFVDNTVGTVIANHMLYHIPDIDSALSEVRRVLKPGGMFYASTITGGGIRKYLHDVMKKLNLDASHFAQEIPFNIENGEAILARHFATVKRHDYIDSLAVTDTKDLIAWIESSISMSESTQENLNLLHDYFEKIRVAEGSINISKNACLFVAYP